MNELLPVFVVAGLIVVGGLVALVRVARRSTWTRPVVHTPSQRQRRLQLGLMAILGVVLALAIGTASLRVNDRREHFRALRASTPALELSRDGRRVTISSVAQVEQFFTLVDSASRVGAHHSHATGDVELRLGDTTYALGRDSSVPEELWLRQVSPAPTWGDATLWQLRSSALSGWFAEVERQLE